MKSVLSAFLSMFTISICLCAQTERSPQEIVADMPSQIELDPILQNADTKAKDFLATLTKYSGEARQINQEKFEKDLRDFAQMREIIQTAHSGRGNHGITLRRVFAIVASLDDAAIEAREWVILLTPGVCGQNKQSLLFAVEIQRDADMLKEVSNQLFHPGFRMLDAGDAIMNLMADVVSKSQPKQH